MRADHIMMDSQFPFLSGVDGVFFTTYSYEQLMMIINMRNINRTL